MDSYEEWAQQKIEQEKRRTHNAEKVTDESLYAAEMAINKYCFGKELFYIPLYFIPPDIAEKRKNPQGVYGYGCIMIDKKFYEENGVNDDVINVLFHEMIHAYCDLKGIEDTIGSKHTYEFSKVCSEHGGISAYENGFYGFSISTLSAEKMKKVKQRIKKGA